MIWAPEKLESRACDLCGGASSRHVLDRADGLKVVQCDGCGLCYLNPRPKPEHIPSLYGAGYFSKTGTPGSLPSVGFEDYFSEANRSAMKLYAEERLRVASEYVSVSGKDCLEVGCATGEMCSLLKAKGARPIGLDLSNDAIAQARTRYPGIEFRQGEAASIPDRELFDVIFAFEFLEHVQSPKAFLKFAAAHLRPKGFLVLTTPNVACGRRVGEDRWAGFLMSFEHLYFFAPDVLSKYAADAGLSVTAWLTGGGNGTLEPSRAVVGHVVRSVLDRLRLLGWARRIRAGFRSHAPNYVRGGSSHNLYMVIQKP